jgi:quinol-cytochrome oxidoreductase complex cytochrome b subunit
MNRQSIVVSAKEFLAERFPVDKLNFHSMVQTKRVPIHSTGLLLLFYYQPTVNDANLSIEYIMNHVSVGALIRNMHAWSSSCMIFCAALHLLTAFAMKSFVKPRELTWIAGVLLLFLTMALGFTGYLLPWNQIAVNATKVGLQSLEAVGAYLPGFLANLPHILRETFQGEAAVGQATLTRFFALHVVLLPMALAALLFIHLILVQLHGMSKGTDKTTTKDELFFPFFVVKDLALWAFIFFVLFTLSLCVPFDCFLPFPLLKPYNALGATPPSIKPEWYFYFLYYPLEVLPFWLVLLVSMVGVIVLFLTPWIFKNTSRQMLGYITIAASSYLFVMTVFGQQIYEWLKR